ncbi:MAG: hypothetical protein HC912_05550 [Saprospiraceae bacterium]|nr:hypothetical protein [Saprospiraceae bacterium]
MLFVYLKTFQNYEKINLVRFFVLLIVSVVFLYSCEKEERLIRETKEESTIDEKLLLDLETIDLEKYVQVQSGILKFNSYEDLERVYNFLVMSSDREKKLEWAKIQGFTSADEAFEKMTLIEFESEEQIEQFYDIATWRTTNEELYLSKVIRDFTYSPLYNEKSVLLVENDLLKYMPDEILIYGVSDLDENFNLTLAKPKR